MCVGVSMGLLVLAHCPVSRVWIWGSWSSGQVGTEGGQGTEESRDQSEAQAPHAQNMDHP